jgi:hypothetical protein
MNLTAQIAKHLRDVYFGGNWTASNLKDNLKDVTWEQATTSVFSFNTIATLVFHTNYYVNAIIKVLQGGPLDASDKLSFDCPVIASHEDWQNLLDKTWAAAETLASLIEQMPDSALTENFSDGKYGTNFRNVIGNIEHIHYHLGQIALIRKVVLETNIK